MPQYLIKIVDVGLPGLGRDGVHPVAVHPLRLGRPHMGRTVELIPLVEVWVILGKRRIGAAGVDPAFANR